MALLSGTDAKMRLNSRLQKSRHGIYYLRVQRHGFDRRWSLHTRDPIAATLAAHELSARILSMTIDFSRASHGWVLETNGNDIRITTEDNDADRKSATEALIIAMQSRTPTAPVAAVASTESAAPVTQAKPSTVSIGWALAEYQLHLMKDLTPKSEPNLKTRKQALSALRKLVLLLDEDFNMSGLSDEVVEDIWLPDRLKNAVLTTARRDLSYLWGFVEWAANKKRAYAPAKLTFSIKAESEYTGHSGSNSVRSKVYGRNPISLDNMHKQAVSHIDWNRYCGWSPDVAILKAKADQFIL